MILIMVVGRALSHWVRSHLVAVSAAAAVSVGHDVFSFLSLV